MGATFNRLKNWVAETLTAADLNAEINNILDNFTPSGMDDYSTNTTEMQTQTDPGEVGTESLANSMAGELARLRHQMAELKGTTYWYTSPVTTLASLNTAFGTGGLPPSRLISGASASGSSQSILLTPEGAGNGNNLVISGATTDLVYSVDNTEYTLSSDVTIASTTAPPIANNTAAVNDASLADAAWTKYVGLYGGAIPIDTIGSEITSRNGKITAFKLTTGAGSEYFLGIPDTTNNQIKDIKRGWFFDESAAPIPAIVFADNDTITLMNIAWVFLENDNTANVTYNEPVVSAVQPTTPTNGDFWYDQVNSTWKLFDGVSFNTSNCVFVGIGIVDENGDCVGARSDDFVKTFTSVNTSEVNYESATQLKTNRGARIGVYGSVLNFFNDDITWDITSDLDTGSEAASTMYFFYVTETGLPKISIQAPIDMTNTRGGYYHPHQSWRCLAQAWNNSSSDLEKVISYHTDDQSVAIADSSVAANALTLEYWTSPLVKYYMYDGADSPRKVVRFPIYQNITVPSGATLGHITNVVSSTIVQTDNVVLHHVTNNDFITLGVSSHQHGQGYLQTTVVLGTGSDNGHLFTNTLYTDANVNAVAVGKSPLATPGTWDVNLINFHAGKNLNVCRIVRSPGLTNTTVGTTEKASTSNLITDYYVTGKRALRIGFGGNVSASAATDVTRLINAAGNQASGQLKILIDGTAYYLVTVEIDVNGAADVEYYSPSTGNQIIIHPGSGMITPGLHTFTQAVQASAGQLSSSQSIIVEELPYEGDL